MYIVMSVVVRTSDLALALSTTPSWRSPRLLHLTLAHPTLRNRRTGHHLVQAISRRPSLAVPLRLIRCPILRSHQSHRLKSKDPLLPVGNESSNSLHIIAVLLCLDSNLFRTPSLLNQKLLSFKVKQTLIQKAKDINGIHVLLPRQALRLLLLLQWPLLRCITFRKRIHRKIPPA